jgi:acylphosphatase
MKLQAKIWGSKVHEVGYRVFLLHKAIELGGQRFSAYNRIENGSQLLVALIEGDEEQIAEFKRFVEDSRPDVADVSSISFEEHHGYVMSIDNFMHISMVEQLNKGIPAFLRIDQKQDKALEKQDKMLEKQDKMLEKLDEMKTQVVGEMIATREVLGFKLDSNCEAITSEIGDQRITLDDRLKRIEEDISKLKAKVGL